MLTQEQALAELRQLNQELGLAEDDGMPMTQAQAEAELRALDEELASTPESFDEYVARRKEEDSRSLGEKTSAFTDSFITGAGTLVEEGGRAIKQLFAGDVGLKEAKGVFQVGVKDFGRFAKTLGGAAMDNFYSDENEMRREYERYKDNFLYNQNVRTAMLDTFDEKGRDFVSFGANFVDPTMFIPIAGQVSKAASVGLKSARLGKVAKVIEKGGAIASKPTELIAKGTRKALEKTAQAGSKIAGATGKAGEVTSKVAAFPRDMVTKLASKTIDPKVAGSGILGAQVTGAFTGAVPGLGLLTSAEVAGYIANKSGRGMERVLTALGSEAGQKRFLQRLAMQADSPLLRKRALQAHKWGGTRMGDMAFNSLVNGISVSTLNGALAYASTDNIEELGQAMGAGFAMGGALPVGQPGMRAGRSQAARNQSSVNFLEAKLGQDQLKHFRKMDPDARLAFATVEEAGIKAPKLMFVDKNLMLETLRQDDPNIRQAPNAYFDQKDNTIYVNENGRASKSSKEAFDILTHELGHGFITQAIKDDPFFARKILEQYEAKPGEKSFEFAFTKDSAGAPIDSIMLNEDAKKIASAYDSIQEGDKSIGVGQDANLLAQEIGAEQFAMMMVDNPNYFNTIEPSLRQKLLEGSRKVLTLFGAVDGNTGNPLDVSISPILKRNKSIRNLYKNYTRQRDASIADKVDLADKGVAIKVRKGESADQAVERLYGKQGISLKEAGAFRIDNKKVKNELTNILNRVDETPEGGMSSERNPRSGRPQAIVGKQLSDEVKGVFTRKDPRGTINMLINDITESIRNRLQLNFLYRSGKPSKYSDNELKARVVSPVRFKVTGLSKGSTSAASLKMDAIDEAYLRNNVEVLVKEGFADNPNDLIELARKVAREALDDEEGRINPQGNYENELVTAVFGQPESAPQIRNAKLRQLLEDKKLQHAYRSYDVDALAGLVPTGKSGIAFDWFNIKNNYSPFDDKLFIPKPEADVQITDKLFMPMSKDDNLIKSLETKGHKFTGHPMLQAGQLIMDGKVVVELGTDFSGNLELAGIRALEKGAGIPALKSILNTAKENEMAVTGFAEAFGNTDPNAPKLSQERLESLYKRLGGEINSYGKVVFNKEFLKKRSVKLRGFGDKLFMPAGGMTVDQIKAKYPSVKLDIYGDAQKGFELSRIIVPKDERSSGLGTAVMDDIIKMADDQGAVISLTPDISFGGSSVSRLKKFYKKFGFVENKGRNKDFSTRNTMIRPASDKLFMPASEAGAGKGKQAEAAKLWQEKGTDSPYFKKWFGKSKVVDENGDPLVVYHGTSEKFKEFNTDIGGQRDSAYLGGGSYFSTDKNTASSYGKKVLPVYLKIEKPKNLNFDSFIDYQDFRYKFGENATPNDIKAMLEFDGHDGVIASITGESQKEIVAFSPEQIKSATGNRGTFDAGERNILFMPGKGDITPASVQSWDDANPTFGANFTKGMAKDNKEAAALLRKSYEDEFGEPIKAQDFTQEQVEWLGGMLAQEGEAALGRTGNAVNWYTSAVEKALSVAEEIFPEIGQKFEAKDRFLGALSITSQNMRVMDNAKAAVSQYQHKIRTGKFNYNIKHGAKADAITSNLKLYDKVEAKMGVDKLNDFLDADFTVKELIEWGRDFFGDKKFSIAGYSTDKVKGSAIFGPKIGQGFFQNLRGNYDPVTVDLWLRRTYGRLTGLSLDTALSPGDIGRIIYAVRNNKGKRKFAGLEMPEFLKGVSISGKLQKNGVANFKISDKAFESLFGDNTIGRDNYEAIYEFAEKLNREWERSFAKANTDVKKAKDAIKKAKKEKRGTANLEKQLAKFEAEKVAIGKEKPQWAKAGSTVNDKLKPIDVPSNAERAVITKAFDVALKSLKEKGIDLTPADLQATLWYPEKDIWAYLKGESSDALNMSYDTAMEVIRDQR